MESTLDTYKIEENQGCFCDKQIEICNYFFLQSFLSFHSYFYFAVDAWTIAFSPEGRFLASGSHVGKINLFGVESAKKESQLDTRGKFTLSIAYVSLKMKLLQYYHFCKHNVREFFFGFGFGFVGGGGEW